MHSHSAKHANSAHSCSNNLLQRATRSCVEDRALSLLSRDVRFTLESGHFQKRCGCPLGAKNGHQANSQYTLIFETADPRTLCICRARFPFKVANPG